MQEDVNDWPLFLNSLTKSLLRNFGRMLTLKKKKHDTKKTMKGLFLFLMRGLMAMKNYFTPFSTREDTRTRFIITWHNLPLIFLRKQLEISLTQLISSSDHWKLFRIFSVIKPVSIWVMMTFEKYAENHENIIVHTEC